MSQETGPCGDTVTRRTPVLSEMTKEEIRELLLAWTKENHYIDAALRSSRTNQVFIFCYREYVVVTYDPTAPGQCQLVKGPLLLCDGFPTLYKTDLHSFGVDAAFGCHGANEAYLFGGPSCVKVEYGPNNGVGNAPEMPRHMWVVFPCLESISYEFNTIDAAFESTVVGEAYLFKGPKYALFNYAHNTLIRTGLITDEFPCLSNTKFASHITAAFASHVSNQVYLFKDDNSYVIIYYQPGKPDESYIVSGPDEIVPSNWPALQGIVPYKKPPHPPEAPKTWTPKFHPISDWIYEMEPPPLNEIF